MRACCVPGAKSPPVGGQAWDSGLQELVPVLVVAGFTGPLVDGAGSWVAVGSVGPQAAGGVRLLGLLHSSNGTHRLVCSSASWP